MKSNDPIDKFILPLSIIFFSLIISHNLYIGGEHFSLLSESLLRGKLYFLREPVGGWIDTTFSNGQHYWPSGPFPIIFLTPFVFVFQKLGIFFYQGYIQPFLVAGVFFLVYKIANKSGYLSEDSFYWAFAFCFSTVFLNVALWPAPWGFAQVLTTLLLFLVIYGYLKSWPLLIQGVLTGATVASRFAVVGTSLFFILTIMLSKNMPLKRKLRDLFIFLIPVIGSFSLICVYNYIRFGNFFDNGYANQILTNENLEKARDYGLFNLIHMPGNLYYFLLSSPLPVYKDKISHVLTFPYIRANPWGMSIFITSPIFLKLFFLKYKDLISKIVILTVVVISIPIFLYYGVGWRQAGYRYSLDFLPFLFWLLMRNYQTKVRLLSVKFKIIVLLGAIVNLHFVFTAFLYP